MDVGVEDYSGLKGKIYFTVAGLHVILLCLLAWHVMRWTHVIDHSSHITDTMAAFSLTHLCQKVTIVALHRHYTYAVRLDAV
jgi:hypothetical protein